MYRQLNSRGVAGATRRRTRFAGDVTHECSLRPHTLLASNFFVFGLISQCPAKSLSCINLSIYLFIFHLALSRFLSLCLYKQSEDLCIYVHFTTLFYYFLFFFRWYSVSCENALCSGCRCVGAQVCLNVRWGGVAGFRQAYKGLPQFGR